MFAGVEEAGGGGRRSRRKRLGKRMGPDGDRRRNEIFCDKRSSTV